MVDRTSNFIRLTKDRSSDNLTAIISLHEQQLYGQALAILRQELDSLIRVCYLLTISDQVERLRLIEDTLNGQKWRVNNKVLTDREMVTTATHYNHWAPEVYEFGNAFTHLTNFHDFRTTDPLQQLDNSKKALIIHYLNSYHQYPTNQELTFQSFIPYILRVAQKVSGNLGGYLEDLEQRRHH